MSVYGDILTAVKTRLQDLDLVADEQVAVRKRPVYLAEHDAPPMIVVSPNLDLPDGDQFSGGLFVGYEVWVTLYHEAGFAWEVLSWLLDAREDVRQALHVVGLAGASTVFDGEWLPNPAYDVPALPAGVDVSRMAFRYTSAEARNG